MQSYESEPFSTDLRGSALPDFDAEFLADEELFQSTDLPLASTPLLQVEGYSFAETMTIRSALKLSMKFMFGKHYDGSIIPENEALNRSLHNVMKVILNREPAEKVVTHLLAAALNGSEEDERSDKLEVVQRKFGQKLYSALIKQLSKEDPYEDVPALPNDIYSTEDLVLIDQAVASSIKLFGGTSRKWGPNERLPLVAHTFEVGMLLGLAGCKSEVVVAGLLHDAREGYVDVDLAQTDNLIQENFGELALNLIIGVTEPPKDNGGAHNFRIRKEVVLENLRSGCMDLAALSCATKISTLAAGNKFLWMQGDVCGWSEGSKEENVVYFAKYLDEYRAKGVSQDLLLQFEEELERFKDDSRQNRNIYISKAS